MRHAGGGDDVVDAGAVVAAAARTPRGRVLQQRVERASAGRPSGSGAVSLLGDVARMTGPKRREGGRWRPAVDVHVAHQAERASGA